MKPELEDAPRAVAINRATGQLKFDRVDFSYDGRPNALNDIRFEAEPGMVVGLHELRPPVLDDYWLTLGYPVEAAGSVWRSQKFRTSPLAQDLPHLPVARISIEKDPVSCRPQNLLVRKEAPNVQEEGGAPRPLNDLALR
ncbi:MAG: hypothetical protein GEU28_02970 [Dehalococcoidia bacterium]|nr:hypothetical protein [Dehalococcoidia bacterium]